VELLDWNDLTNVNSDGSVKKKMIQAAPASEYSTPNDYAVCDVSYRLTVEDHVILEKEHVTYRGISISANIDLIVAAGLY